MSIQKYAYEYTLIKRAEEAYANPYNTLAINHPVGLGAGAGALGGAAIGGLAAGLAGADPEDMGWAAGGGAGLGALGGAGLGKYYETKMLHPYQTGLANYSNAYTDLEKAFANEKVTNLLNDLRNTSQASKQGKLARFLHRLKFWR